MIRKAQPKDAQCMSRIVVDGWRTAYKEIIESEYLNNLNYEEKEQIYKTQISGQEVNGIYSFVYEDDESQEVLGFIVFGKSSDESDKDYNSEIYALYIKPDYKYHGIGTELFDFAKKELRKQGKSDIILWCLKNNFPTIKFYKKMGGEIVSEREINIGKQKLKEVGIVFGLQ